MQMTANEKKKKHNKELFEGEIFVALERDLLLLSYSRTAFVLFQKMQQHFLVDSLA